MDIKKIQSELSNLEKRVLLTLDSLDGSATPTAIVSKGNFDQEVEVMNAASWLQSKQLVTVKEQIDIVYSLGPEGERFTKIGLPEKRAACFLRDHQGSGTITLLSSVLEKNEIPIAIGWLKQKGWATITKKDGETVLTLTEAGMDALQKETDEEALLRFLSENPESQLDKKKYTKLLSRKDVIKERELITGTITLTDEGYLLLKEGHIEITEDISQISSKIIKEELWKKQEIRPYDIHAFAPNIYGGKPHPMRLLINKIKNIFIELGFQEIEGNYVESCFWNMDVLFIPQDHPAREMQDTFYCKNPKKISLSDEEFVNTIATIHENGGNTGSTGWGYKFSQDEGERALLRTHTTVNTIRYLYEHPNPPAKIFSIGQVFRKENIDATHLPLFYQIEGIIHEKNASFTQLIGILAEFYKRMGFEKIRFRPGYFPYTEPSMEVEVFWNNSWMELGGSGIFRPEVTEPLSINEPVLAWGLGVERLAMLKYGLSDIRSLYQSDLQWLQKQPLL